MRIGLFTDTYLPDINGVVTSTAILKKALEKRGHEVFVITNHSGTKITFEDGILRLPGMRLKMLYGYNLSSPINQGATETIRGMNLDIIHLQTNFGVGLYGQRQARHFSIPCVTTYHTMYEDYTHYINPLNLERVERISREAIRRISRTVCNSVQAVVAPSEKTRQYLEEYGVLAPIYVVPSGLDLDQFYPTAEDEANREIFRKSLSEDEDAIYFLYLGRMAEEKCLEMLIEAFGQSDKEHYHLVLTGDGPDLDKYKELAASQPHSDRLHFTGSVETDEVGKIYRACDAFVSASLSETQGITYLEALASGKMVFGRRDPVLSALIEEGKTGFYFDNPKELIEKCEVFEAMDPETRKANALLCMEKATPYSSDTFAKSIEEVYQAAIDRHMVTYKVLKAKEKGDFVELELMNEGTREESELWIPYDDYFELEISRQARLAHYLVEYYQRSQNQYKAYYQAKKRALAKDSSAYMIETYLKSHFLLNEQEMNQIVEALIEHKLVDDEAFARENAFLWHDMGYSRKQISMRLIKRGISSQIVNQVIEMLDNEVEENNARILARKLAKTVRNQSNRLRRQTVYRKLLSKGFTPELSSRTLEDIEWEEDEDQALVACYQKAKRLYRSTQGAKQQQKIKVYCMKKGFTISDIERLMEADEELA